VRIFPKTKQDKKEYINRRALELARSGKFDDYQGIELYLRFKEDLPEARGELDSPGLRQMLNDACKQAKATDAPRS